MIRAKFAKRPGAPRKYRKNGPRMDTNTHESNPFLFDFIRVDSCPFVDELSFSSLAFLAIWRAWRKFSATIHHAILQNEPKLIASKVTSPNNSIYGARQ